MDSTDNTTLLHTHSASTVSVTLAEYTALKREQVVRISDRDHFVYAQMVAMGALFGIVLKDTSHWPAVFGVPFVSWVLASLYIANDRVITRIGDYIQNELSSRIDADCTPSEAFAWESFRLRDPRRQTRKRREKLTLQGVFLLPSLAAMLLTAWMVPVLSVLTIASLVVFLAPLVPFAREIEEPSEERLSSLLARR